MITIIMVIATAITIMAKRRARRSWASRDLYNTFYECEYDL